MKKLLILALAVILPLMAEGHPGKTDRAGGHRCLKGCEEWGLFYKEYHLHDKDGKPIRVGRKITKGSKNPAAALESGATPTFSAAPVGPKTDTVVVNRYVTTVYEENIISSNPLVWVLLFLLLLLLILRRNRTEPRKP
jgi:hypothetical protein